MHSRFISEIPPDKFTLIDQIGSGTFSDIFSAMHIKTNTKVALKVSLKSNNSEYDKMLDQEVKISQSLHHPFICKYFYEFDTEHLSIIVMELVEGTTVLDYVNQTHGIPLTEVRNLFTQLLIAIEYLHDEAHITHRDLKLENIMIDNCGHIRLIDFGFSTNNSMMSTICGSIPYCAPEVLSGQLYTKESDIWSMGVILYSLFDGNLPFYHTNTNNLVSLICNSEVKFPPQIDSDLKDLLLRILDKDPSTRIKIEAIKQHPFICNEKLLLIDYKQLFSPEDPTDTTIYHHKNSTTIKISTKLGSSQNTTSSIRKSCFFNPSESSEAFHLLHAKLTMVAGDVDTSIENRKDFAHNLTRLIEGAILMDTLARDSEAQMSLADSRAAASNCHVAGDGGSSLILLNAHMHGSADIIANNHHFALTNHFAGMRANNAGNASKLLHKVEEANVQTEPVKNGQNEETSSRKGISKAARPSMATTHTFLIHQSHPSSGVGMSARRAVSPPSYECANEQHEGPASAFQVGPNPILTMAHTHTFLSRHSVSPNNQEAGSVHHARAPANHFHHSQSPTLQQPSSDFMVTANHKNSLHASHTLNELAGGAGPPPGAPRRLIKTSIHFTDLSQRLPDVSAQPRTGAHPIKKSHRRSSQNMVVAAHPQIIAPVVHPSTSTFSDE